MPSWLLILLAMVAVVLAINPPTEGYNWYQGLRRPSWTPFPVWIPVFWLGIYAALYLSAVATWNASRSPLLLGLYALLLVLLEGYPWLMCRTRRLGLGAMSCLASWAFALALALALRDLPGGAASWMLPLLLWAPLQAAIDWSMLDLNAPDRSRRRAPAAASRQGGKDGTADRRPAKARRL
jgi:tryptophan-rich sensory protein